MPIFLCWALKYDLNLDGFPDILIYFLDKDSKPSILSVSSKNNESLMNIIHEIQDASIEDGGGGAFYIFLKKNL